MTTDLRGLLAPPTRLDKAVELVPTPRLEDAVNSPAHYRAHPSGIEVIQITEHLNFCLGNAVKYVLRADHKGNPIEDLEKAAWYIRREIARREGMA